MAQAVETAENTKFLQAGRKQIGEMMHVLQRQRNQELCKEKHQFSIVCATNEVEDCTTHLHECHLYSYLTISLEDV